MVLDYAKYEELARRVIAEGVVLLKNDGALPIEKPARIALYGRIQSKEYIAGIGSGGLVNLPKRVRLVDALTAEDGITLDAGLMEVYRAWEEENPREVGIGWGKEPWSQAEMPVSEELAAEVAARTDAAIVIIGRSAGEDQDNKNLPGSYLLTEAELAMLRTVCKACPRTVVLLNTGNIIDMSFIDECNPAAVMYIWQGGVMTGAGVADVLLGRVSPSGHLADTIAYSAADYPADANFGSPVRNLYAEDIYVGYRHFETAAKEKVRYPFGFGLSYTTFEIKPGQCEYDGDYLYVSADVCNTGTRKGQCVVQCYVSAPQGALGKAARVLAGFAKTEELEPGDSETIVMTVERRELSSYDDSGATGHESCFVMEAGEYVIFLGENVRDAAEVYRFTLAETEVVEECETAMKPVVQFSRRKAVRKAGKTTERAGAEGCPACENEYEYITEPVPARTDSFGCGESAKPELLKAPEYTGDRGWMLKDVRDGNVSMDEFLAQFTDEELFPFVRGEGMGSLKVTPGTCCAYGGTSEVLKAHGVPCGCCTDGPSGIRLDCGDKAMAIPIGTLIACTFNRDLTADLLECLGMELRLNKVDCLLAPGMNLHRHPLNGRNFEYFSEDPLLTGQMAAAELTGLQRAGVTGTIKHFCCNNQEFNRYASDSVVSERALRELYLRGFEIAIREGGASTVMTTYGRVNGMWTSCDAELNTKILREQWGFDGFVMTDWWAAINDDAANGRAETGGGNHKNFADMVLAQNDTFMICPDGSKNTHGDNLPEAVASGKVSREVLLRTAANVCGVLMRLPTMLRMYGEEEPIEVKNRGEEWNLASTGDMEFFDVAADTTIDISHVRAVRGADFSFGLNVPTLGGYEFELTAVGEGTEAAQLPVTCFFSGIPVLSFVFHGTDGKPVTMSGKLFFNSNHAIGRMHFSQEGLTLVSMRVRYLGSLSDVAGDPEYAQGS
ncbi:MAG: glycoside hydrolase family 3 protein [Lachnospiraceae bacterium]|nr:glycoside hydrolase family 3 protein [Lachnospiraceae bacterium]